MTTDYRAEQVGSLLRPAELHDARSAQAAGQISLGELRRQEDRAILAALDKQKAIGIDIRSDGELRRASWLTDMADAVDGFVPEKVTLKRLVPRHKTVVLGLITTKDPKLESQDALRRRMDEAA